MRVVIAFDKFKESMSAFEACQAAASPIMDAFPNAKLEIAPICDGGEGFCEILSRSCKGEILEIPVTGPGGEKRTAKLGLVNIANISERARNLILPNLNTGTLAIVEMAQASGLWGLDPDKRDPWKCTSFGTGELLLEAAKRSADAVLLGIGGSATNDLGLGALEALGLTFFNAQGEPIERITPAKWKDVTNIAGTLTPMPQILVACDVSNPLLGPHGATATFGPQKGLPISEIPLMDEAARKMATMVARHFDKPGSILDEASGGAAGGLGWGLRTALNACYLPGFEVVWEWMDFEQKLQNADLVITGEGSFDSGSLGGKGPGTLAEMALANGQKVIVLAGRLEKGISEKLLKKVRASHHYESGNANAAGIIQLTCTAISPEHMPLAEALRRGPELLQMAVKKVLEPK